MEGTEDTVMRQVVSCTWQRTEIYSSKNKAPRNNSWGEIDYILKIDCCILNAMFLLKVAFLSSVDKDSHLAYKLQHPWILKIRGQILHFTATKY